MPEKKELKKIGEMVILVQEFVEKKEFCIDERF
jgi:hypothetical protein